MKRKLLFVVSALFIFNAGIFGSSYVLAGGCSDPVVVPDQKNRFLSMSGCKPGEGTCVIVRCPIVVK